MRRPLLSNLVKALALGWLLGLSLLAQAPERFLDQSRPAGDGVRLVVFNPIVYNLKGLVALREKGILAVPGLRVVGVFHARQKEDFEISRKFVADNHLDWIQFHTVVAPISEAEVYQRNACTPDIEAILKQADGVIFFGGSDIPAALFGQKTNLLSEVEDPFRNYLELSAIFQLLGGSQAPAAKGLLEARPGFPILGICLGFQSLNVGTGGSLQQDIWSGTYRKQSVEDVIALGPEQWHNNPYKRLFPQDKAANASGQRRELQPIATETSKPSSLPSPSRSPPPPACGIGPLLERMLDRQVATMGAEVMNRTSGS